MIIFHYILKFYSLNLILKQIINKLIDKENYLQL